MKVEELALLQKLICDSAQEMFSGRGRVLSSGAKPTGEAADDAIVATIGFAGNMLRGALTIVAPPRVFDECHPLAGNGSVLGPAEFRDWAAEVANQVVGRFKNKLLAWSVVIQLGTPTAISGQSLRAHVPRVGDTLNVYFDFEGLPLAVMLSAEALAPLYLDREPSDAKDVAHESDCLMF